MSSFSHHFHRHHYAPAPAPAYYNNPSTYAQQMAPSPYAQQMGPSYGQQMAPSTYGQQMTSSPYAQQMTSSPYAQQMPYINAQGVLTPPGHTYYESMKSPAVQPVLPQYIENTQQDSRLSGIKSHLRNRISHKYHYSDVSQIQTGYDAAGYPVQQQYESSGYLNKDIQQSIPQQRSAPPSPLDLPRDYVPASSSPSLNSPTYSSPSFATQSFTAPIIPGTPPTVHTPLPPTSDSSSLPNGRPRSLPRLSTPSSAPTTPVASERSSRRLERANSSNSNRLSGSHLQSSSRRSTSDGSATNRTVVAAIPTNMAHEERRQLAVNLLSEIDAYERMQSRVFLFRLLPPLRFRVTVVRNVDGVPQQTETMMTMAELRVQLQHALDHDSQMVDQLGMTYENLVGLSRVQLGVKDVNMFPTFTYTNDCHIPSDKSTCSVCLSDFQEGDNLKTVPCMHLFHTECIDEWLKMSKVCPVCKTCVESDSAIPDDDDDCHKVRRDL